LELFTKDSDIIFIDEAQKIMNIGNTLKILIDKYKNKKQIIVT
jgi:predicted AAA+ superfamily ATPase